MKVTRATLPILIKRQRKEAMAEIVTVYVMLLVTIENPCGCAGNVQ